MGYSNVFVYLAVNCVLLWNSEGRSVLKVSPLGREITDAKEIVRQCFRITSAVNSMVGLLWKLNKGCQCSCQVI